MSAEVSMDSATAILLRALATRDDPSLTHEIEAFQGLVLNDEALSKNVTLGDLAIDLDFFEADRQRREQDVSFFDSDRARELIRSALKDLLHPTD